MYRIIGITLIVVGAILIFYGFQEGESLVGEMEEAVTGSPPDRSIGMIIGGVIAAGVGIAMIFVSGRRRLGE